MNRDSTSSLVSAQPIVWKPLLVLAAVHFLVHAFSNGNYGIFRDEYYYLACAERPAWGYVDQPPFSIWVLALWKAVFGQSIHSIRILPALCGSALIVLTGAVAARLGGGNWAQVLAGAASGIGAAGLVICGFYSMNCFDFLVWIGAYYFLIRIAESEDGGRWWPWLGLLLGVGLFNKVGVLVLGAALGVALIVTPLRRSFRDKRMYLAGFASLAFLLPYVLWNISNDWPTRQFIDNAKQYKIADFSPLGFLGVNILEANPANLVLWLAGLIWLLTSKAASRYRFVGLMVIVTWILLVLQKSKPYYFVSSFPVLLAAGGVAWERWTRAGRWQWARWLLAANVLIGLAIFLPMGLPILSPTDLNTYLQRLGIGNVAGEVGHTSALPQHFSDRFGWENLAEVVAGVYAELPDEEKGRTIIIGRNYGHSGALEYWSSRFELPPVYGRHNNYWLWGPPDADENTVVIAINFDVEGLEQTFAEVEVSAIAESEWALESHLRILVCRGLKRPIREVWEEAKLFI